MLDDVDRTGEPVTITKRGRPVARLVPAAPATARYAQDTIRGTVEVVGDIIAPALPPERWGAVRRVKRRR